MVGKHERKQEDRADCPGEALKVPREKGRRADTNVSIMR